MLQRLRRLAGPAGVVLCLGFAFILAGVRGTGAVTGGPTEFEVAKVQFEQNATDKDFEVVFEVMGGGAGLGKLTVVAPNGRKVVDFAGKDTLSLGIRQFRFESPEPKDLHSLQVAYPEGEYVFSGSTAAGAKLHGRATLSHKLPAASAFVKPAAGAEGVALRGTVITWKAVPGVAAYVVYIEQEELDQSVTAKLPGTATSFTVPDGFLLAGTEYVMGVSTVMKSGNGSTVEASFTTAK